MSLPPSIAHFRITAKLGEGGMGEVYRATDTKLGRNVAIKVISAAFASDASRMARFAREAQVLAALNHPNIAAIYGVEENALVLELVEGPTLAERIAQGPMPVEEALPVARQIADALEYAHERGVIHRDLKPANIKLTAQGRAKVLDFGLAKLTEQGQEGATALTQTMSIAGTPGYLAPEQLQGKPADARSDIFAFGCVLYELLSGRRAFPGGTLAASLASTAMVEPKPIEGAPNELEKLVRRCLRKDPARRIQHMGDVRVALLELQEDAPEATVVLTRKPTGRRALLALGTAAGLALGLGLAALLIRPPGADFSAYKFKSIARDEATERYPKWSPDGKSIAYTAEIHGVYQIFMKGIDSSDTAQLTHAADSCTQPFWSPDGATIYYISHGDLWSVGASGGTPELAMENASSAALHPDGKTVAFLRDGKLWAGPLRGGAPREIGLAPDGDVTWMAFSPDGSRLAAILLRNLWILEYPSGASRNLGIFGQHGSWFPDSRHLVVNGGNFGNTMLVVDSTDGSSRVMYRVTGVLLHPSVSPDGKKILYSGGAVEWDVLEVSLANGQVHTLVGGGGVSWEPDWAPSGTHYLFSTFGDGAGGGIVDRSAAEGFSRRVADAPPGGDTYALGPQWAPDGTRFLFAEGPVERMQLAVANASGRRPIVLTENVLENAHAWSPDGQWVVFLRHENGKEQVVKMKPGAGAPPQVLASGSPAAGDYSMIQWSPAGDWIAYPSANGTSMVSPDGKTVRILPARNLLAFAFSNDGAQVYGVIRNTAGQGALWQLHSIDVKNGADRLLAPLDFPASTANIAGFSLHPDGKRFLTSIAKWPYDIWMLEGFDQPKQATWLDRLLRR
jgi:serine/threonine-protein kinase